MRARQQQPIQIYGSGEMVGCQRKGAKTNVIRHEKKQQQQQQLLSRLSVYSITFIQMLFFRRAVQENQVIMPSFFVCAQTGWLVADT